MSERTYRLTVEQDNMKPRQLDEAITSIIRNGGTAGSIVQYLTWRSVPGSPVTWAVRLESEDGEVLIDLRNTPRITDVHLPDVLR